MIILTIRTDKEEAELGLYDDSKELAYVCWPAHRQLAETIHKKLEQLLNPDKKLLDLSSNFNGAGKFTRKNFDKNFGGSSYSLSDIGGIVAYKGPGSFTGLRVGLSTAN